MSTPRIPDGQRPAVCATIPVEPRSHLIEPAAKSFERQADLDADREPPLSVRYHKLRARCIMFLVCFLDDGTAFCENKSINKSALLEERRPGFDITMAAAMLAYPEKEDSQLILDVRSRDLGRGFAQHVFVDTILRLDREGKLSGAQRSALKRWAKEFRDPVPSLAPKLASLGR